jgi:GNAT superfamily N-acetyltransferase
MELFIRALSESDIDGPAGLAVVRQSVIDEIATERGGPLFLAERSNRSALWLLDAANGTVADSGYISVLSEVILADDALVGWSCTTVRALPDGARMATIEELGVESGARAIGAGELLLESILKWCRTEGCRGVDSFALPGARETKNFFETFGMKARLLTVHMNLLESL